MSKLYKKISFLLSSSTDKSLISWGGAIPSREALNDSMLDISREGATEIVD